MLISLVRHQQSLMNISFLNKYLLREYKLCTQWKHKKLHSRFSLHGQNNEVHQSTLSYDIWELYMEYKKKTKQNKTKQNKTKKTKQNKTKQNKTKQNKKNKTKQNKKHHVRDTKLCGPQKTC